MRDIGFIFIPLVVVALLCPRVDGEQYEMRVSPFIGRDGSVAE